jgi:hypothetical protein
LGRGAAHGGCRLVDPAREACRDQGDDDGDGIDVAFVADDVEVVAVVDELRARRDDVRCAGGIVGLVEGRGAGLHDDEAGAGVAVPAEGPARRDRVLQHVEVRGALGPDSGRLLIGCATGVDVGLGRCVGRYVTDPDLLKRGTHKTRSPRNPAHLTQIIRTPAAHVAEIRLGGLDRGDRLASAPGRLYASGEFFPGPSDDPFAEEQFVKEFRRATGRPTTWHSRLNDSPTALAAAA